MYYGKVSYIFPLFISTKLVTNFIFIKFCFPIEIYTFFTKVKYDEITTDRKESTYTRAKNIINSRFNRLSRTLSASSKSEEPTGIFLAFQTSTFTHFVLFKSLTCS